MQSTFSLILIRLRLGTFQMWHEIIWSYSQIASPVCTVYCMYSVPYVQHTICTAYCRYSVPYYVQRTILRTVYRMFQCVQDTITIENDILVNCN